jgi:hypothetical protein
MRWLFRSACSTAPGVLVLLGCSSGSSGTGLADQSPPVEAGPGSGTDVDPDAGSVTDAGDAGSEAAVVDVDGDTSADAATSIARGDTPANSAPVGDAAPRGGPACGLSAAAFCDTFDAPSSGTGRAGELDDRLWSASRFTGTGTCLNVPTCGPWSIGPATLAQPPALSLSDPSVPALPACRAGLPAQVYPDQDTLICDPSGDIGSSHLMVAVAAQNYGQNSYRIRQPFDFSGRTGKIVFDAEGYNLGFLWGWVSLEVTDEPIPAPGYSLGALSSPPYNNEEGTALPKNGFEVQFNGACGSVPPSSTFSVGSLLVVKDYAQQLVKNPSPPTCVSMKQGKLNHFELDVSKGEIDVYASPYSDDGKTFGAAQLLGKWPVSLPLTRGWVTITTHNHATLKYTGPAAQFPGFPHLDAWEARWDNVGFDGPAVTGWREYDVLDAKTMGSDGTGPYEAIGWTAPDSTKGPSATLHLAGVDTTGMTSATLSLMVYYLDTGAAADGSYTLRYRVNGKGWHDRPLGAEEVSYLSGGGSRGDLAQTMPVPVSELVPGDNTVEFVTANAPQSYVPVIANVTLALSGR